MCTPPNETLLRSFFLKVFFLPFLSGAAAAPPAAAGFAMKTVLGRQSLVVGKQPNPTPAQQRQKLNLVVSAPCSLVFATTTAQRPTTVPMFLLSPSSSGRPFPCADLCASGRWYGCAGREPAGCGDDG